MTNQLINVINTVELHHILDVSVRTDGDKVESILVLVKEGEDVLRAANGRRCAFERFDGEHHRYKLSVDIDGVVVYTYIE